jgi:hypothetical protein
MIPANTVAETITGLRQDSNFYAEQIKKNADLIERLKPLAEWGEPKEVELERVPTNLDLAQE